MRSDDGLIWLIFTILSRKASMTISCSRWHKYPLPISSNLHHERRKGPSLAWPNLTWHDLIFSPYRPPHHHSILYL